MSAGDDEGAADRRRAFELVVSGTDGDAVAFDDPLDDPPDEGLDEELDLDTGLDDERAGEALLAGLAPGDREELLERWLFRSLVHVAHALEVAGAPAPDEEAASWERPPPSNPRLELARRWLAEAQHTLSALGVADFLAEVAAQLEAATDEQDDAAALALADAGAALRTLVQQLGPGPQGQVMMALFSSLAALEHYLAGRDNLVPGRVGDAARAAPALEVLARVAETGAEPDPHVLMTELIEAGTRGASAEADQQARDRAEKAGRG